MPVGVYVPYEEADLISDYQRLARTLASCVTETELPTRVAASLEGEMLANTALAFWRNPTRQMISAARVKLPTLSDDEIRTILIAIADEIKGSNDSLLAGAHEDASWHMEATAGIKSGATR